MGLESQQNSFKIDVEQKTADYNVNQVTAKYNVLEYEIVIATSAGHNPSWVWEDGAYILWEDSSTILTES